jgi:hypothetical protein
VSVSRTSHGSQEAVVLPLTRSAQDMTSPRVFSSDSNSRFLTTFLLFSVTNTGGGLGAAFLPGDSLRTAQAKDCGLNNNNNNNNDFIIFTLYSRKKIKLNMVKYIVSAGFFSA